ncbi:MAG: helix-turn-helix transcriptional regulator [Bacteriovoracales bacterium]|nr:helix-turn-helix transcriptional regulator [Bacteriovoracales bacterium]
MAKIKTYKNVEEFSKGVLKLNEYDSWLISTKNTIIESIVKSRQRQSISQKELAEMLGTTQSVISRIENGFSRHVTLDYLIKVASILGLSSRIILKKAA